MSSRWDYAVLTKNASSSGGPEKYINTLVQYGAQQGFNLGVNKGKKAMVPITLTFGGICFLGGLATSYIPKAYNAISEKWHCNSITKEEAIKARESIISSTEQSDNVSEF